ncbi:hypothetical protein ONE63_001814 [Megalurothrips usitatus]|uniref:Uncharacterized protein n=1 Tax=Megalurothrips usitatus TaxID=439358 RepID=A0AAV7XDJ3_9NEOP|nr:hypothetical protein ONE63_001814 [Megalurothrips usitatus]
MHEYRNRYGSVSGGSALSKSMKYAETWLYGTVSARPAAARASAFGLHRHDATPVIAVVMCSCPEFLAGTTRSKKTASTCKKCGGTRRPMPTTVGTVRGYGTVSQPARVRPSLMELTGNPLLHAQDPYDLMRRSRMSVEGGGSGGPAQTAAPQKTHHHKARAKAAKAGVVAHPAARVSDAALRAKSRDVGEWAVDDDDPRGTRKSILECDVNPYDLISKYLKNGLANGRQALRSDGGESSDNLSDNALEDLPRGDARARTDMTTFGKGPQQPPQPPQPSPNKNPSTSPFSRKALFQKEDLNKLGAKFSHLKQSLTPDSKAKPTATPTKKTDYKIGSGTAKSPGKQAASPEGVTISGQRIRIFNGVPGAAESTAPSEEYDAPTTTSSSEEDSPPAAPAAAPATESPRIPRVASPKRPPRKSKQQLLVSQEAPEASSPSALQLRRQRSQSLVSPVIVPEAATTIKSILKKSPGGDLLAGSCGESSASSSPRTSPAPSSAEGSISSATSQFYLPTFKEFKEQQKKKKQVQFRVSDDASVVTVADAAAVPSEAAAAQVKAPAAEPAVNGHLLQADDSDVPTSPEPGADVGRVSSPEGLTSTDDEIAKETATDSGESSFAFSFRRGSAGRRSGRPSRVERGGGGPSPRVRAGPCCGPAGRFLRPSQGKLAGWKHFAEHVDKQTTRGPIGSAKNRMRLSDSNDALDLDQNGALPPELIADSRRINCRAIHGTCVCACVCVCACGKLRIIFRGETL